MANAAYIQIGVKSKRTPTGEFLPAEPIYAPTDEKRRKSGLTESEESVLHAIAALFASKHIELEKEASNNVEV